MPKLPPVSYDPEQLRRWSPWLLLGITAAYLWAELHYNLALVGLVSNPDATKDTIAALSHTGKQLASFGLVWSFVVPGLRRYLTRLPLQLALFFACWLGMYQAVNWAYDKVLDSLSASTISNSVSLLAYRVEITSGRLKDPNVSLDGRFDPLAMIALPVMAFDERPDGYMAYARTVMAEKVDSMLASKGGDAASLQRSADDIRQGYQKIMRAADRMYKLYIDQSMRVAGWPLAEDVFKERTGGLSPNPMMTRDVFFTRLLPQSSLREARQITQEWTAVRSQLPDGSVFRLSDLPPFLADAELDRLLEQKMTALSEQGRAASRNEMEQGPESRTYATAVLVPPISMTLSLFTLMTGFGTLVYGAVAAFGLRARAPILVYQLVPVLLVMLLTASSGFAPDSGMAKMEAGMTRQMTVLGPVWRKATAIEAGVLALTGER